MRTQTITAVACLAVAVLSGAALAQSANLAYSPSIIYYTEPNYGGTSAQTGGVDGDCYGIGIDLKSFKLSPSSSARFYSDWGCQGSDLGYASKDDRNARFDKKVYSVRLTRAAGDTTFTTTVDLGYSPGVQLYSLPYFGGWSSQTGGSLGCFGFENPTGSFRLTKGAKATFYSDWGCTGTKLLTTSQGNKDPKFQEQPRTVKFT